MQKCFEKLLNFFETIDFKQSTVLGVVILLLDQLSKSLVENLIDYQSFIKVFDFFNIACVHNYGVTFGFLRGKIPGFWFGLFSLAIVICVCVWIYKDRKILFGGSLVVFGAIGNIIDRFTYGYVVDFLDFHILDYHWPAFNVADMAIVCGNIIILLTFLCDNDYRVCGK